MTLTPAAALAAVLTDELVRVGVTDVVLAPGSRSAPLAYALHAADAAGRLRVHVRIDERSAAFLALGLAKGTGVPAPVVTTSGTAVANLGPAVLEAHEAGVPMVLLTADRPPELRGTRANQTTDQLAYFGSTVRWFHDLAAPEAGDESGRRQASWRTAVDRAVAAARGSTGGPPGPVHLNLPLRDPLAPDGPLGELPPELAGRPTGAPWTEVATTGATLLAAPLPHVPRTVVVLGDPALPAASRWAHARGYPVIGEPFGRLAGDDAAPRLPHGARLAALAATRADLRPDRVVVVGRLTLSRSLAALTRLEGVRVDVVSPDVRWADPGHVATAVHPPSVLGQAGADGTRDDDAHVGSHEDTREDYLAAWTRAAHEISAEVEAALAWPSGPGLASAILEALPDDAVLFLGSSNGVRHIDLVRGRRPQGATDDARVDGAELVASRGLAGIDGCVSTAVGIALASARPTYAYLGDLTFLHDANGLVIGPHEPRPDLTIVVGNDDGGAIFETLEYGEPERRDLHPGVLERMFRTPTGTNIAALCAAHGVRHVLAKTPHEVYSAVAGRPAGITVVETPLPAP